jgi:hypothetical protein
MDGQKARKARQQAEMQAAGAVGWFRQTTRWMDAGPRWGAAFRVCL